MLEICFLHREKDLCATRITWLKYLSCLNFSSTLIISPRFSLVWPFMRFSNAFSSSYELKHNHSCAHKFQVIDFFLPSTAECFFAVIVRENASRYLTYLSLDCCGRFCCWITSFALSLFSMLCRALSRISVFVLRYAMLERLQKVPRTPRHVILFMNFQFFQLERKIKQ